MKRECSKCNERSIPGLRTPLCQFHYDEYQWGTEWARKCRDAKERTTKQESERSEKCKLDNEAS